MPHRLRRTTLRRAFVPAAGSAVAVLAFACGSRTGLDEFLDGTGPGTTGPTQYLPDGAPVPPSSDDGGDLDTGLDADAWVTLPDGNRVISEGGTGGEGGGPPPPPKDVCGEYVFQLGAAWPSFQRCPFHAGYTDVRGPKNPVKKWQVLSPMGGTFQWPFAFFGGGPTIAADGTIYLTLENGGLEAISAQGNIQWAVGLSNQGWYAGSPSVSIAKDGTIYVGLDRLYALTPGGQVLWNRQFPGIVFGGTSVGYSPALAPDGTVYAAGWRSQTSSASGFFALAHSGTDVWSDPTLDMVSDFAVGRDGTIFVGDTSGQLVAVDPTGTRKWLFAVGDSATDVRMSTSVGPDGVAYIGATTESSVNTFYAVNPDGSEKWRVGLADSTFPMAGSPALAPDGTIYVIDAIGGLNAIDPSGNILWTYKTTNLPESGVSNAPIIDGSGTVFFITSSVYDASSTLYAVTSAGKLEWSLPLGGFANGPPAIGNDGTLYVATSSALYAIGN